MFPPPMTKNSTLFSSKLHACGSDHTATTPSPPMSSSSPSSSLFVPACNLSLQSSLNTCSSSSPAALAISSVSTPPLLCVASELDIIIYDLDDLRPIASAAARPDSGSVKSVKFSTDGEHVFTAHQDCGIRAWSTSFSTADRNRRLSLVATLPTFSDCLRRFAFPKNYIQIRRHKRTLWIKHADAVSSLATHDDFLYSASWDKTVKVWHVASSFRCLASIPAHDDAVNAVVVAPDGVVYTASADSLIKAWTRPALPPPERNWNWRKKKKKKRKFEWVATLEKHSSAVNALALGPDGSVLYSGGCDGSIVVWEGGNFESMCATAVLHGHEKSVMCLATADDLVVSGSTDRTVRIWQRGEGCRCVAVLLGHQNGVRSVAACRVNPNGNGSARVVEYRVCSGSVDGEVRIWRVSMGR